MNQTFSVKNCHLTSSKALRLILKKSPFKRANRISRRSLLATGLALSTGGWWQGGFVKSADEVSADASPVIAKLIRQGKLVVAGGVYDLNTGLVTPVEVNMPSS
jgi:hypothetical protein